MGFLFQKKKKTLIYLDSAVIFFLFNRVYGFFLPPLSYHFFKQI